MPSTGDGTRFQRLASAVETRMHFLGYENANAVEKAGGPTWDTVIKILAGDLTRITNPTVTKLETALIWPTGTVRKILDGEAPPEGRVIQVRMPTADDYSPEDFKRLEAFIERSVRSFDEHLRGEPDGVRRGEGQ